MWLGIETSSEQLGVALWQPATKQQWHRVEWVGRGMSARLHPLVQELLAEAGVTPSVLTGVALCTGPGSFTSLRLGLAAAEGLGLALNIPVVGVGAFRLLLAAARAEMNDPATAYEIWLRSMAAEVYTARYGADGTCVRPPATHTMAESMALALAAGPAVVVGHGGLGVALPPGLARAASTLDYPCPVCLAQQAADDWARGVAGPVTLDYLKPLNYRQVRV